MEEHTTNESKKEVHNSASTQTSNINNTRKSNKGLAAFIGCFGCLGLLVLWVVGAYFLLGPTIQEGIEDFQDSQSSINTNFNFDTEEYFDDINANTNTPLGKYSITEQTEASSENRNDEYNINYTFGVLENGKFFEPISLDPNEPYTLAVTFDREDLKPGDTVTMRVYVDGARDDYVAATFSAITEDEKQQFTVDVPANSSTYYLELFLYINDELVDSHIISTLQN